MKKRKKWTFRNLQQSPLYTFGWWWIEKRRRRVRQFKFDHIVSQWVKEERKRTEDIFKGGFQINTGGGGDEQKLTQIEKWKSEREGVNAQCVSDWKERRERENEKRNAKRDLLFLGVCWPDNGSATRSSLETSSTVYIHYRANWWRPSLISTVS